MVSAKNAYYVFSRSNTTNKHQICTTNLYLFNFEFKQENSSFDLGQCFLPFSFFIHLPISMELSEIKIFWSVYVAGHIYFKGTSNQNLLR